MKQLLKSKYQVLDLIAQTPYSETYHGELISTSQPLVIKVYRRNFLDNFLIQRLGKLAEQLSKLSSPQIARVRDGDYGWKGFYFIRDWVHGDNLGKLLGQRKPLDPEKASHITTCVSAALRLAHEKGITHGSLHPHNIFVSPEGKVRLTDFNLDQTIRSTLEQKTHRVFNAPTYLSPEEIQGQPSGKSSDIYSVGILLYQMLAGEVPFHGKNGLEVALKHLTQKPLHPTSHNPKIPAYLEEITLKALQKDPWLRFESAEILESSLKEKIVLIKSFDLGISSVRLEPASPIKKGEDSSHGNPRRIIHELSHGNYSQEQIMRWILTFLGSMTTLILGWIIIRLVILK